MSNLIKILIAEDNPADALLVRAALEEEGSTEFELTHVDRLSETLERLSREPFDLLLLDLGLPDSQGVETMSQVRKHSTKIPVVVLTGLADGAAAQSALGAGAQDYIVKGHIEGSNLVRAIRYSLERHNLLAREQDAREQAETASRAKSLFLAVLSHELRTPLTPILLIASTGCEMPELPRETLDDFCTIKSQVELEVKLIDDLLNLASIHAGKVNLRIEQIDAHELIRNVGKDNESKAAAKNLTISFTLEADIASLDADPLRMKQIVDKLLDNAIKFSKPMGNITIHSQSIGDDQLRIEVIDTGVGIEPEVMPRIFRSFEQGEQVLTRRFGGLGIGLAISKGLVELLGGTIEAFSDGKDRGARFTLDLPRKNNLAKAASRRSPIARNKSARPLRILHVEDDRSTAEVLARLLRTLGHHVSTANSVADALRALEQSTFDFVLADIGLPDGTGWDLMRQIQSIRPIRGIALSGFASEEDLQKSLEAGFLCHLHKPINMQQLSDKLAEFEPAIA